MVGTTCDDLSEWLILLQDIVVYEKVEAHLKSSAVKNTSM